MAGLIVPIVEGKGEVKAAAGLIRRVLFERIEEYGISVGQPLRLPRGRVLQDLARYLEYAKLRPDCSGIMVLVDADDDCPLELAISMAEQAVTRGVGVPVAISVAKTEYESWFIASIESIRGRPIGTRGVVIDGTTTCPSNVEEIRGAKRMAQEEDDTGDEL